MISDFIYLFISENKTIRQTRKSTTYGAIMDPTWLDVLLVPKAEFLIFVGNISAVWTTKRTLIDYALRKHFDVSIRIN